MKTFLRENPTLAYGLGLPLLLALVFILVSGIPTLMVSTAQYDVLYTTGYRGTNDAVQISVVEQRLQIRHHDRKNNHAYANPVPRLWRYSPQTGAVTEIVINWPASSGQTKNSPAAAGVVADTKAPKITLIEVPDLDGLSINASSIAPDGYEFQSSNNRNSGNIFRGLFGSNRYNYVAKLTKNGRNIRLPNSMAYNYNNGKQFVGWVISQ